MRILTAYREPRPEASEQDRKRQAIEGPLRLLGDLFVLGHLPKNEYETRRDELRADLARMVDPESHGQPEMLDRIRRYAENAGADWDDADDAQRNRLVRARLESVSVKDRHLVAACPRPELQPYLTLAETKTPTLEIWVGACTWIVWRARGDSNPRSRP